MINFAKRATRKIFRALGYELVPLRKGSPSQPAGGDFPPDFDEVMRAVFERVKPFTMTSKERVFALCKSAEYVVKHNIPGDIVECGVWKGGSMMAVAQTLIRLKATW